MLDITSLDAMLKEYYDKAMVESLMYKDNPLFGLITKVANGGNHWKLPVIYGPNAGRSRVFATAQTGASTSNTLTKAFQITNLPDFAVAQVSGQAYYTSMTDADAFMEAMTLEVDSAIYRLTRSISQKLFRSGYGEIGKVGSSTSLSGSSITLSDPNDVTNFEVGDQLVVAADVGTSATRALGSSGNGLIITSVDRDQGILYFAFPINDATNGIPTIATSDIIFYINDRDTNATPTRKVLTGLGGWCPATAPTSGSGDSFFGVDRGADPTRLAGVRIVGNGNPIEEVVVDASTRLAREGSSPDHLFLNPQKFADLEKALGAKVIYDVAKIADGDAEIGFRTLVVQGPKGPINVVSDLNCPFANGFMVELDQLVLTHLGDAPVFTFNADGLQMLRIYNGDGVESRQYFIGNLGVRKPNAVANIAW